MKAEACRATVLVRRHGEVTCQKEAGHDGPHEADVTGKWKRVSWTEGTTFIEPDAGDRPT